MKKVLFVCRGNIGRSQMAEAIFNLRAPEGWTAFSMGTKVFDKEGNSKEGEKLKDREGAEQVLSVLREMDIEASEAERNQITEEAVLSADQIVIMAEKETWPSYLHSNDKLIYWDIIEPKAKDISETRAIREQISGLVEKLILDIK